MVRDPGDRRTTAYQRQDRRVLLLSDQTKAASQERHGVAPVRHGVASPQWPWLKALVRSDRARESRSSPPDGSADEGWELQSLHRGVSIRPSERSIARTSFLWSRVNLYLARYTERRLTI